MQNEGGVWIISHTISSLRDFLRIGDDLGVPQSNRYIMHQLLHVADLLAWHVYDSSSTKLFEWAHSRFVKQPFRHETNGTRDETSLAWQLFCANFQRGFAALPQPHEAAPVHRELSLGLVGLHDAKPTKFNEWIDCAEMGTKQPLFRNAQVDSRTMWQLVGVQRDLIADCLLAWWRAKGSFTFMDADPAALQRRDAHGLVFKFATGVRHLGGVVALPLWKCQNQTLRNAVIELRDGSFTLLLLAAQCQHCSLRGRQVLEALRLEQALVEGLMSPTFKMPVVMCRTDHDAAYVVVDVAHVARVRTGRMVHNTESDRVLMLIE